MDDVTLLMSRMRRRQLLGNLSEGGGHSRCKGPEVRADSMVDGQGGLACCNSWGRKELDTTERLN